LKDIQIEENEGQKLGDVVDNSNTPEVKMEPLVEK